MSTNNENVITTSSDLQDVVNHSRISHTDHNNHQPINPATSNPTIQEQQYEYDIKSISSNTLHNTPTQYRKNVYIGTRDSQLAMWQAKHVYNLLHDTLQQQQQQKNNNDTTNQQSSSMQPNHTSSISIPTLEVVGMKTLGDIVLNQSLTSFSNKGVFTKELDIALLNGNIDCAVHCMKDLPTTLPTGIRISATLIRGNVRDAVIINSKHIQNNITTLAQLPHNSIIGTSALRRIATLHKHYPHLVMKDVRGNINTRLSKLDNNEYDALILAATGLERIELHDRISEVLDPNVYGYAVGQGALCILTRTNDTYMHNMVSHSNHIQTDLSCEAERALLRTLQGGCKVPITVHTKFINNSDDTIATLELYGSVLSVDGKQTVENTYKVELTYNNNTNTIDDSVHNRQQAVLCGNRLAELLLSSGADVILNEIHNAAYTQNPQQRPNINKSNAQTLTSTNDVR